FSLRPVRHTFSPPRHERPGRQLLLSLIPSWARAVHSAPLRGRSAGQAQTTGAPCEGAPPAVLAAGAPSGAPHVAFLLSGRSSGKPDGRSFHFAPIPAGEPAPPFIRSTSSHLRQPRLATARAVIRDDPKLLFALGQEPRAPHSAPPNRRSR